MDKTLRSILWILAVLILFSSFSAGWFFIAKEKIYDEYVNLEVLFKTNIEKLNSDVVSLNEEKKELKGKLELVKWELNSLELKNKRLGTEKEKLSEEKNKLRKELSMIEKRKTLIGKNLKDVSSQDFMAGLLKQKVALEVESKKWKDILIAKDLEVQRLRQENMDLNVKFSKNMDDKELLEQQVKNANEVSEVLSRDLLAEKTSNTDIKKMAALLKTENQGLQNNLSEFDQLRSKMGKVLAEKDSMQMKMAGMEKEIGDKDNQIERLKLTFANNYVRDTGESRAEAYHSPQEVDLPPIVLERQSYAYAPNPAFDASIGGGSGRSEIHAGEGKIITVNREHNFVVIDIGKENNINVGARFNVYRGSTNIGSLEVIQARDKISACDIVNVQDGFFVAPDDRVVKP